MNGHLAKSVSREKLLNMIHKILVTIQSHTSIPLRFISLWLLAK